jgi:hypothetical protein
VCVPLCYDLCDSDVRFNLLIYALQPFESCDSDVRFNLFEGPIPKVCNIESGK